MSDAAEMAKRMNILLVEDNAGDIELMQEALYDDRINMHVHCVRDGSEALDFLYRRGAHQHAAAPDIILLDLNMPRTSGKEVLAIIKGDEALQHIPVIILTSSEAEQEVAESYRLHANAYIVKPSTLDQLLHVAALIKSFWLVLTQLPPHPMGVAVA